GVSNANTQASSASTQVSTASTQVSTANLSDATIYAFLANQPNGGPRNQDRRKRNQDNSRRTVNVEETSFKAMAAIHGAGFDWSYMADDEVPTNMALIAFSDSEFNKSEFHLATYKRGLASVEEQLVFYKKNEPEFEGYGPKTSKSVSEDISNEIRESPDALLVKELVSDDNRDAWSPKETKFLVLCAWSFTQKKIKAMYDSGFFKYMTGKHVLISQPSKAFDEGYVTFGEEPNEGKLLVKGLFKTGKLDGKSDEGLFVRYSMNSKAFRVYNIRTRKVEENLHIRFLEDKPIIVGTEESIDAGHSSNERVSNQHYILMPLWKDGLLFDSSLKNASNDEPQPSSDAGKKDDEGVYVFSLGDNATLEATHADFFGDETKVDMSNITTTYPVPSTPNTRIHKDHSLDHVIGDVQSGKVWTLVDLPYGKRAIGKKWVYMREMDVKSAFLYGKIEKEVYVCQPPGAWYETLSTYLLENGFQKGKIDKSFFIKKVMQKEDVIFISQDKYVDEILKKFGFLTMRIASTHMETSKPLLKDAKDENVNVHLYRSMIGSLMHLTASRPNIMFVVCACARFQATPKVSHLHAMKRIFRYLKGQPKLGLWYPKDSSFDLEAYSDSDYASASLDWKSTTGGVMDPKSNAGLWIQLYEYQDFH
ncbi:hypothetical protein Tco_0898988, partial [Tanacetum coccineum]